MANFDDDNGTNESNNETFQQVIDARLSRRGFLGGGLTAAAGITLGGASALLKSVPVSADVLGPRWRNRGSTERATGASCATRALRAASPARPR